MMRNPQPLQTKRMHHQPIRSPSPDIANRNIIKDTKVSTEDIKRYLEKSRSYKKERDINSYSPKLSELTPNKSKYNQQTANQTN